jgi:hypothetical protein
MESTIDSLSNDKVAKATADAAAHLERMIEALSFLVSLTSDTRQHSSGKLKQEEPHAIEAILATVRKHPRSFAALKLDPGQLSELLARRALLVPLAQRVRHLAEDLDDTILHLGEVVKSASSAAYRLGIALAESDSAIAHDLQPAQQFYQAVGRAAARSRRAHGSTQTAPKQDP